MFNRPKELTTSVVVLSGDTMSEDDLNGELASMSKRTMDALIQLIDALRNEYPLSAARQAQANNPLAMASDSGAYEALTGLMRELIDRRKPRD